MEEALALIEKIIEEHKAISQRMQTLEQVANDIEAIVGFEKAKDAFLPGRLEEKQGLQKFQELLQTIDQGIRAHFNREETTLLTAFEKQGDKKLASALYSLLLEHDNLRNRLVHANKDVIELTKGELSRQVWEASAYDMRAYVTHTRELFEAHAQMEHKLLMTLRKRF